jgi:hypothetical protein
MSPTTSPGSMAKLTSFRARIAPKLLETLRTSSNATNALSPSNPLALFGPSGLQQTLLPLSDGKPNCTITLSATAIAQALQIEEPQDYR